MKIAFLLNHYDVHQVPHVVPYAFQLSLRHPNSQVLILSPGEDQLYLAEQIGRSYPGHKVDFVKLQLSAFSKLTDPVTSRFLFSRKFMTLFENTALWSAFNAIVVPETNTTQLRRIPQLKDLKLIRVCHGAGDQRGLMAVIPATPPHVLRVLPIFGNNSLLVIVKAKERIPRTQPWPAAGPKSQARTTAMSASNRRSEPICVGANSKPNSRNTKTSQTSPKNGKSL